MSDFVKSIDETPVTLVIAIAYGTLAVVTRMFGDEKEFVERLAEFGWLTPGHLLTGEPWRLLSHAFLHGGVLHLAFNMMMLFGIGPQLERSLGSLRFGALYLVAALGGGLMVCLTYDPRQAVLGGSGALFGMLGCAVAINMRSGRHAFAFLQFEGPRRLLGMIAANLILGFLIPFISNAAHIGGLCAGFAFTLLWLDVGRAPPGRLGAWRAATLALFAAGLFASFCPVTRFDWLVQEAEAAAPERQERLVEASKTSA